MSKRDELIGNSRRNLVLKTSGSIKVLVGDKYYDLNFRNEDKEEKDNNEENTNEESKNEEVVGNFIIVNSIGDYENGSLDYPGDGKIIFTLDGQIYYTRNYTYIMYNASYSSFTTTGVSNSSQDFENTVNFNGKPPLTVKNNSLIQNLNAQYLNGKRDVDFLLNTPNQSFNNITFNNMYSIDGGIKYEDGKLVFNKPENEYIYNTIKIGNSDIISIKELEYSKIIPYKNTLFLEVINALYDTNIRFSFAKDLIEILNCNDFNWDWLDNDNKEENYKALVDVGDYLYCNIKNTDKWDEYSLSNIRDRYSINTKIDGASYVIDVVDSNQFKVGDTLSCNATYTLYKPSVDSDYTTYNRCEAEEKQWLEYEETKSIDCVVTSIYNNYVSVTTNFKSKLFEYQEEESNPEIFLGNIINIINNYAPDENSNNYDVYNCIEDATIDIYLDYDIIGNLNDNKCDGMDLYGYGLKVVENSYFINPYIRNSIEYKKLDSDYELNIPHITEYSILSNGYYVILPKPKLNGLIVNIYTNDNMLLKNGDEVTSIPANNFVSYRVVPVSPDDYKWIKF